MTNTSEPGGADDYIDGVTIGDVEPTGEGGVMGIVTDVLADQCDEMRRDRDLLAVALRKLLLENPFPETARNIAWEALNEVFPGDPTGDAHLYSAPPAE